mgnify:CR=1 FL=1
MTAYISCYEKRENWQVFHLITKYIYITYFTKVLELLKGGDPLKEK